MPGAVSSGAKFVPKQAFLCTVLIFVGFRMRLAAVSALNLSSAAARMLSLLTAGGRLANCNQRDGPVDYCPKRAGLADCQPSRTELEPTVARWAGATGHQRVGLATRARSERTSCLANWFPSRDWPALCSPTPTNALKSKKILRLWLYRICRALILALYCQVVIYGDYV